MAEPPIQPRPINKAARLGCGIPAILLAFLWLWYFAGGDGVLLGLIMMIVVVAVELLRVALIQWWRSRSTQY